jgi:hypothetical protein
VIASFFDRETGAFRRRFRMHDSKVEGIARYAAKGEVHALGDFKGCYFDFAAGEPRPLKEFAPEIGENRIAGLPPGTAIEREARPLGTIAGEVAELETDYEERLKLVLRHPHYRKAVVRVPCAAGFRSTRSDSLRVAQNWKWLRAAAYPPMADYLDGLAKGDAAQIEEYLRRCREVKAKFPKPGAKSK